MVIFIDPSCESYSLNPSKFVREQSDEPREWSVRESLTWADYERPPLPQSFISHIRELPQQTTFATISAH